MSRPIDDLEHSRRLTLVAACCGVMLVALVAIAGDNSNQRAAAMFLGFGSPFLVALVSSLSSIGTRMQRVVWFACGLGGMVTACFFLWNGTGFLLALVAGGFVWASVRGGPDGRRLRR